MAFTYVDLTGTYELATDVPAVGEIELVPVEPMRNGVTVVAAPVIGVLDSSGALVIPPVAATTDPATTPPGVTYRVVYRIVGQPTHTRYVSVPHDQGASVELEDLGVLPAPDPDAVDPGVLTVNGEAPDGAGNLVLSASDVGAQLADADLDALATLGDGIPTKTGGVWGVTDPGSIGAAGAVASVNGLTGAVVLNAATVGAQPEDADLTALAALTPADGDIPYRSGGVWTTTPLPSGGSGGGLGAVSSVNGRSGDVTGLAEAADLTSGLATKAAASHTHAQSDVTGLVAALAAKTDAALTSSTRTGSYSLAAADVRVEQVYNSASGGTFTVPTDASQSIAVGESIPLRQFGAGQLTIAGAGGVTVNSRGGALKLAGQHAVAELRKTGANAWVLAGDVTT